MTLNLILSEKGKFKLCLEGFIYVKDKEINGKNYWRCELFQKNNCKARVVTDGGSVSRRKFDHNHAGDAAHIEATMVMNSIREEARNTRDAPQYIVSQASIGLRQSASAKLPSVKSIKRTIQNVRVRQKTGPAVPNLRRDIIFPN